MMFTNVEKAEIKIQLRRSRTKSKSHSDGVRGVQSHRTPCCGRRRVPWFLYFAFYWDCQHRMPFWFYSFRFFVLFCLQSKIFFTGLLRIMIWRLSDAYPLCFIFIWLFLLSHFTYFHCIFIIWKWRKLIALSYYPAKFFHSGEHTFGVYENPVIGVKASVGLISQGVCTVVLRYIWKLLKPGKLLMYFNNHCSFDILSFLQLCF